MRPPVFHITTDQDELQTGWEMYQLDEDVPGANREEHHVVFRGLLNDEGRAWVAPVRGGGGFRFNQVQ
jgi:hypothetical protein